MPQLNRKNLREFKRQLETVPGMSLNRWSFIYRKAEHRYKDVLSYYAGTGVVVTFKNGESLLLRRGPSTLADLL